MLKEEIITFLKGVSPFDLLGDDELGAIVEEISLEYYPKGLKILAQNGPPAEHLRLIKKGGVKVFMIGDEGKEITIDFRSEGEQFGIVSIVSGDRSRATIVAVEDTICYLVPKQRVLQLLKSNPKVNEYFVKSFFLNFIDRTYEETRKRMTLIGKGERVLFTTPVKDIVRREPACAHAEITIKDAAGIMAREQISSLILVDTDKVPVGIITDRDLREKVVARGRDFNEAARLIMSSPLIRVDASEHCFEALLRMIRYNIHHLLVIEGGSLLGVVTNHDFMVLQGSSPMVFVKEIESAHSVEDLATARPKLTKVVAELLREGARASNITGLITELVEKFLNKAVDIVERKLGPSPLPYTLFIYGNGGRREFTLNYHIRLGIVFDDASDFSALGRTEKYFDEFVRVLTETLQVCGVPSPDDAIVRSNVMGFGQWKDLFNQWSQKPFDYSMDEGFFDMRTIRGDETSCDSLLDYLTGLAAESELFMDYLATVTVRNRPPLGFFKRFVVEKGGEHINELNLYQKGIRPLVDSVRVFSLEKKGHALSTTKRLQFLRQRHSFEQADDVAQSLEYLMTLIIHDQVVNIENGASLDSFLNPEQLSGFEKKTLKEIFMLIASLYDIIEKGYRTERLEETVK